MNAKRKLLEQPHPVRWHVFMVDQTGQQSSEPERTFHDLEKAKDLQHKLLQLGQNAEVKTETLPQFIGRKTHLERLLCVHKSTRESIEADMLKNDFSREDFVIANKRARVFGNNYGRTIAFTTNDHWVDWREIDHFSTQFLYTQGFLWFLPALAETYAEQAFWQARIEKYKHQYESTRKAIYICGHAIASVILGSTKCDVMLAIDYGSSFDDPHFQVWCSSETPAPRDECIALFSGAIAESLYFNTNASELKVFELIESDLCINNHHAQGKWHSCEPELVLTMQKLRENRHLFSEAFELILNNFQFVKIAAEKLIESGCLDFNEVNSIMKS
jgi:hypothetical protein